MTPQDGRSAADDIATSRSARSISAGENQIHYTLFIMHITGGSAAFAGLWFALALLCAVPTALTSNVNAISVIDFATFAEVCAIPCCYFTLCALAPIIQMLDQHINAALKEVLAPQASGCTKFVVVNTSRTAVAAVAHEQSNTDEQPPMGTGCCHRRGPRGPYVNPVFTRPKAYLLPDLSNHAVNELAAVVVVVVPAVATILLVIFSIVTQYWSNMLSPVWRLEHVPCDRMMLHIVFYMVGSSTTVATLFTLRMYRVAIDSFLVRSIPNVVVAQSCLMSCGRAVVSDGGFPVQSPESTADELVDVLGPMAAAISAALSFFYVFALLGLSITGCLWFIVIYSHPDEQRSRIGIFLYCWIAILLLLTALLIANSWLAPALTNLHNCTPRQFDDAIRRTKWYATSQLGDCDACRSPSSHADPVRQDPGKLSQVVAQLDNGVRTVDIAFAHVDTASLQSASSIVSASITSAVNSFATQHDRVPSRPSNEPRHEPFNILCCSTGWFRSVCMPAVAPILAAHATRILPVHRAQLHQVWDGLNRPSGRAELLRWYRDLLTLNGPLLQVRLCGVVVDIALVIKLMVAAFVSAVVPTIKNLTEQPPSWLVDIPAT